MTWHDGLPSRSAVARLLQRAFSLVVVVFGIAGCIELSLALTGRDVSSNVAPFNGWQLYLAVAALGVVGLIVVAAGLVGLRRFRPLGDTPISFQILAAFVAIVIGWYGAVQMNRGPEHVLNWAASHTAAAARSNAEDAAVRLQMLGDATHLPMPFSGVIGSPIPVAPRFATAPLLRPAELGPDWHLQGPLKGSDALSGQGNDTLDPRASGVVEMAQEKWNGQRWVQNVSIFERDLRFVSAKEASVFLSREVQSAKLSSPTPASNFTRMTIDRYPVWGALQPGLPANIRYYVAVGSTALELFVMPTKSPLPGQIGPQPTFSTLTNKQILEAAIARAVTVTKRTQTLRK